MELWVDGLWADGLWATDLWLDVTGGSATNVAVTLPSVAATAEVGSLSHTAERILGLNTLSFVWTDHPLTVVQGVTNAQTGTRSLLNVSDVTELVHIK